MRLFQQLFQEMLETHNDLFVKFKAIHDRYKDAPEKYQAEFNSLGNEVLTVVRKYEDKLCGTTERSSYSRYSHNLSEKFWKQVRAIFPKIDFVGVM